VHLPDIKVEKGEILRLPSRADIVRGANTYLKEEGKKDTNEREFREQKLLATFPLSTPEQLDYIAAVTKPWFTA
jgi:hypothetical protein